MVALVLSISPKPQLLDFKAVEKLKLQNFCAKLLVTSSQHHSFHAAVLCGIPIPNSRWKSALQQSSLIHLIVVSGSHLVFIALLLQVASFPATFSVILLFLFSLMTGWQAPVVRALSSWILRSLQAHHFWRWPADLVCFLSGIALLVIFPSWWSSLSFLLSWSAALALSFPLPPRVSSTPQKILLRQLLIFWLLLPLLSLFTSPHPLSVLVNFFLVPLLSALLIPYSLLAQLAPAWTDPGLDHLLHFLELLALELRQSPSNLLAHSLARLWLWLFAHHLIAFILRIYLRRNTCAH